MNPHTAAVALGVLAGTGARLSMLRADYRQYPSYPQAYTIHLTLGAIAAFLGAVAVPAIITEDFSAATFLALAATQFREVRSMERETLNNIEATELVARGPAYIEGIARVFEARNYLAMVTALLTTLAFYAFRPGETGLWTAGIVALGVGVLVVLLLHRIMQGRRVGSLADVEPVAIEFDGPALTVGGNRLLNVGDEAAREKYQKFGLAVLIRPRSPDAKATLANTGQRQAIAHNAAALLGVRKDVDTPIFTPVVRRNIDTGDIVLVIVPAEPRMDALIQAVADTPVLEGALRKPLQAKAARLVD